ncbi:MAG: diguanylate cyclase domain-containing protein, partial [Sciscionella sp.]
MTQQPNEPPPPSPGSAAPDDAPLRALAARWATEALRTSHVPLSRPETIELMFDIARSMAAAVTADEQAFTTNSAVHAATQLIGAHFTGAEALGCSVRLLTTDLLGCAGLPDTKSGRDRVGKLCERLAVEYTEALRERLLAEQEMIKLAVFAAERARSETEARLTAMFNASAMGIGIADLSLRVVEANPALENILGYSATALRGHAVYDFIDPLDRPRLRALFSDLIRGNIDKFTDDSRWLNSDGEPVWIHLTVSLVRDSDGAPDYPVAMLENASEENLLRRQLHHQVIHDDLTGLANSSKFNTRLESLLANAEQGDRLALCYLDLDGFKVINDGVGKAAGDAMLRHVASTLKHVFKPVDGLVARMAGDGFAVLISNPSSPTAVTTLIEDTLTRLGEPVYFEDKGVAVSASVGIVEHAATDTSANYLITAAEITTHRAKLHGKAQWMLFEPGLDERDRRRFQLAAVMPGALENGEFVIRYQPVIRLA